MGGVFQVQDALKSGEAGKGAQCYGNDGACFGRRMQAGEWF